jgi:C4-type Zn-finger protein
MTKTPQELADTRMSCPVCGKKAVVKAYGPFFTPDKVYRSAMTCPDAHWRGRMCATSKEASEQQP